MADIELAELIENLRGELSKARQAGEGEGLRFEVAKVELELTLVVSREGTGSGKVKFWVVEVGGEAKAASAATQRMKLDLTPRVAGEPGPAMVAGEMEPGER
jgi:hypothetical protein